MAKKRLHQGWVVGDILQLRIHPALQVFTSLER